MADVVEKEDINEALRLMEMSKQSLYEEETGSQYVVIAIVFCAMVASVAYVVIASLIVATQT